MEIGSPVAADAGQDVKVYIADKSQGRIRDGAAVVAEEEAISEFTKKNKVEIPVKAKKEAADSWVQTYKETPEDKKISGEWISEGELKRKADVLLIYGDLREGANARMLQGRANGYTGRENLLKFNLPESWSGTSDQPEIELNGLRIKLEPGTYYFKVEDLYKLSIIPKDFNEKVK
ncbi:hypothetical protein [Paenibacillus dendritiformis]|uniref:hypothetical protein n=1 Tax=Paenibacillus dendritiformis TaxID=130049 RepID=UPI00387E0438